MVITSILILPHGAMVLDGNLNPTGNSSESSERTKSAPVTLMQDCTILYNSCVKAVQIAKQTKPDVIFLDTPHGIRLSEAVGVYTNKSGRGNAEWNGQWKEYQMEIKFDYTLANTFVEHLQKDNIRTEGISAFSNCEMPLRWGEIIPLWFLQEFLSAGINVVIFSLPLNLGGSVDPKSQEARIGNSIATFLRCLNKRVLYVVSGDLAHTHDTDCEIPLYLPDPRWNMPKPYDKKVPLNFDLSVENWIKAEPFISDVLCEPLKSIEEKSIIWTQSNLMEAERWMNKSLDLKGAALSCGIKGFSCLHCILRNEIEHGSTFKAEFICRLAPTYYGMMVAAYISGVP